MYIQLNLEDTKAFRELSKKQNMEKKYLLLNLQSLEAIRKYPKRICLAAGAFLSVQVTFYTNCIYACLQVYLVQIWQEMICYQPF